MICFSVSKDFIGIETKMDDLLLRLQDDNRLIKMQVLIDYSLRLILYINDLGTTLIRYQFSNLQNPPEQLNLSRAAASRWYFKEK